MRTESLNELLDMLTYCRPAGSNAERLFIDRYIAPLPGAYRDVFDNWHVVVGESRMLWSSHTDTVHWQDGRQSIAFDDASGIAKLSRKSRKRSHCLGADCTAGVWIMRQMILRGVAGRYIFHYGEERGGVGSGALARHHADWLSESFDCAIAFDRKADCSIITAQAGGRCASDLFALSLSEEIARVDPSLRLIADDWGVFTDTANYTEHIAECSNLSIGFRDEHSRWETMDCYYALRLLEAMCQIDPSVLIVDRDPSIVESSWVYDRFSLAADYSLPVVQECPYHTIGLDCECPLVDHGCCDVDDYVPLFAPVVEDDDNDTVSESDSTYLDPQFAEIQRALRAIN